VKIYSQSKNLEVVNVYVQLQDFISSSGTLKAKIWIVPPAKYANFLNSSVQVLYDTSVDIYASRIDFNTSDLNQGFWGSQEALRAIEVEFDADNYEISSRGNDKWFPFDRYSVGFSGRIAFRVEGSDTEIESDDVWDELPVAVLPYTASLPGWSAEFKLDRFDNETFESSFRQGRFFTSNIMLERTDLNKVLVFLIGFIFLGGGISMLLLFRSILLGNRPSTLAGFIWAGSTAFTMIQTRTVIPGAPRIGIKFDLFIFYPSLVLCFVSGGLMFYEWVSKDSWSREL
jgi:Domain of unknown function (DUF4436)